MLEKPIQASCGEGQPTDDRRAGDEMVVLGKVSGVHGIRGWLKIYSYTEPMEAIVAYDHWYLRREGAAPGGEWAEWQPVTLLSGKRQAKTVIARIADCEDRNRAEDYRGCQIAVSVSQLEQRRGEDEFYWRELIGMQVRNRQNEVFGYVQDLMETGANDVLVVRAENRARDWLIPWSQGDIVTRVDRETGVIEVDWQAAWCE